MPSCYLQVYENIKNTGDDQKYWEEYTSFYEQFWGGPTSPYGLWFGNEYSAFEESLCEHMQIQKKDIKQCLFIKENNEYYICPSEENSKNKLYSYLVNNLVPLHWFLLFTEEQKKVFKTHWGFGAIHYTSTIKNGLKMIKDGNDLKVSINEMENPAKEAFIKIFDELSTTENWLSEFKTDSILILNYGDLLANLPQSSLDKEDSVSILSDIKILIKEKSFSDSEKLLNFLIERWLKIEFSNKKSESLSAN